MLDASASVPKQRLGDCSVTNEITGLSPDKVEELRAAEGIDSVSALKYELLMSNTDGKSPGIDISLSLLPGETLHIAGLDGQWLSSLLPDISEQNLSDIKNGAACLVKNPISFSYGDNTISSTEVKAGDIITVNGLLLRVAGIIGQPVLLDNSIKNNPTDNQK